MVNILITGGTGFIGIPLVRKLYEEGHKLKLLIRETSDISPFKALENVEYEIGDVREIDTLYKAVKDIDAIYHLAGYVKIWAKDYSIYEAINVDGAENIAKVAYEKKIPLYYMSSFGALGPNPKEENSPTDETFQHIDFFQNEYERTKFLGREKVNEYIEKGLNAIIFYPGFVYGPGDFNIYGEMLFDIVSRQFLGIPGKGDAVFCMTYLNDVVDGMVKALNREDLYGEGFVLGGENVTIKDYLFLVAELAEVKKPRKFPMWLGVLYAKLCKFKTYFSKKRVPYITPDMIIGMKYDWAFSSKSAIEKLDYKITPLKEGLTKTIDWYKDFIDSKGSNKKKIGIRYL
jgi:nucleoside-diphosphate-sugar epimerase